MGVSVKIVQSLILPPCDRTPFSVLEVWEWGDIFFKTLPRLPVKKSPFWRSPAWACIEKPFLRHNLMLPHGSVRTSDMYHVFCEGGLLLASALIPQILGKGALGL